MKATIDDLKQNTSRLLLDWCRAFQPLFAEDGALELDKQFILQQYQPSSFEGPLTYNQFVHLAYLLLSEGLVAGADEDEKMEFRGIALANIQYNLNSYNERFESSLYTKGKYQGHSTNNWGNYFLLKSLEILQAKGIGSASLRDELQTKIQGACASIYRDYVAKAKKLRPADFEKQVGTSVNHVSWYMLLLYSAGVYFQQEEWKTFGQDFLKKFILPFQDGFGCWPEGGGIVIGYSMVTAQAVSSFAELAQDQAAVDAVLKYIGFASVFSFPDGTNSVCADCRMTYSEEPFIFLPASFLRSEEGCRICRQRISTKLDRKSFLKSEGDGQGLAFFSEFARMLFTKDFFPQDIPVNQENLARLPVRKASAVPWTAFVSTQINDERPGRFALDTQNFIEIMHAEKGYLVGGGNSKYLPRLSTIRRKTRGRPYIPDRAELLSSTENHIAAAYYYERDRIEVAITLGKDCRISFKMTDKEHSDDVYEGALFLNLKIGEVLSQSEGRMVVDPEGTYRFDFDSEKEPVQWRGLAISTTGVAVSQYPIAPYNPYRFDTLPPRSKYCARLGFVIPEKGIEIIFSG